MRSTCTPLTSVRPQKPIAFAARGRSRPRGGDFQDDGQRVGRRRRSWARRSWACSRGAEAVGDSPSLVPRGQSPSTTPCTAVGLFSSRLKPAASKKNGSSCSAARNIAVPLPPTPRTGDVLPREALDDDAAGAGEPSRRQRPHHDVLHAVGVRRAERDPEGQVVGRVEEVPVRDPEVVERRPGRTRPGSSPWRTG